MKLARLRNFLHIIYLSDATVRSLNNYKKSASMCKQPNHFQNKKHQRFIIRIRDHKVWGSCQLKKTAQQDQLKRKLNLRTLHTDGASSIELYFIWVLAAYLQQCIKNSILIYPQFHHKKYLPVKEPHTNHLLNLQFQTVFHVRG